MNKMGKALSKQQIRDGWRMVRFGDVARQCKESVDRDNNPFERYVNGGHMDSECLKITRWGTFGDDYVGPAFHRIFRKGQILYGSRRTYLKKVAVADFDGITANTTFVIEPKGRDKMLPGLLPFLMLSESFTNHSVLNSKGSTNPYINWSDIVNFEFPLPPVERQKEILEVLEKKERVFQKYNKMQTAITLNKKALQFDAFPNYFEKHHQDYVPLKKGWKVLALSSLLLSQIESGFSAREIAGKSKWYVLNLNCLSKTGFSDNDYKPISEDSFKKGSELFDGDFLISRSNTKELVGLVGIYKGNGKRTIFPDTMMRLKVSSDMIKPEFLEMYLLSPYGRRQIVRLAAGTSGSMVKINKQNINKIPVPYPSMKEQEKIVSAYLSMCEMNHTYEEQKKQINRIRGKYLSNMLDQHTKE